MSLSLLKPPLRFSIRAILVLMTLFAIFLWYHIDWISKRRAAFDAFVVGDPFDEPVPAPALLKLFGAKGYKKLWVAGDAWFQESERDRLRALFPEARLKPKYLPSGPSKEWFR